MLFLLLVDSNQSLAQNAGGKRDRYKGSYWGGQKKFGVERKKFKHIKKRKKRKKLKHKDHRKAKNHSANVKHRKKATNKMRKKGAKKYKIKGKGGSLYASSKKSMKKRKGSYSKRKSKMGSKIIVMGGAGVVLTPRDESLDNSGSSTDVFAKYKIGPSFTAGAFFNLSPQFGVGGKLRLFPLKKDNFEINTLSMSADFVYHLTSPSNTISPYVTAGITYSFTNIARDEHGAIRSIENELIDSTYSVDEDNHILVTSIDKKEPEIRTPALPLFGYRIGAGATYKLDSKMHLYVQVEYDHSFARNKETLLDYFPNNKSDFNFINFTVGIKVGLFKSNSLY